jgi:hypothetical protein
LVEGLEDPVSKGFFGVENVPGAGMYLFVTFFIVMITSGSMVISRRSMREHPAATDPVMLLKPKSRTASIILVSRAEKITSLIPV